MYIGIFLGCPSENHPLFEVLIMNYTRFISAALLTITMQTSIQASVKKEEKNLTFIDYCKNPKLDKEATKTVKVMQELYVVDKSLDCSGQDKYFTDLRELNLGSQKLVSLEPLRGMKNLRQLWFDNNKIASLDPLSQHTKLLSVDFKFNQIESLAPLAASTGLRTIDVTNNKVKSLLPLGNLTLLRWIGVEGNPVVLDKCPTVTKSPGINERCAQLKK